MRGAKRKYLSDDPSERARMASRNFNRVHREKRSLEHLRAKFDEEERLKDEARILFRVAVQNGELQRPSSCSQCGASGSTGTIHGHHPDYSKPLEVVWLCPACHANVHNIGIHPSMRRRELPDPGPRVRNHPSRFRCTLDGVEIFRGPWELNLLTRASRRARCKLPFTRTDGGVWQAEHEGQVYRVEFLSVN